MTRGKILRKAREEAGMTQVDATVLTRIPQSQISDYERDVVEPGVDTAVRLLRAYGVDVLDLTLFEQNVEDSDTDKGLYLYARAA